MTEQPDKQTPAPLVRLCRAHGIVDCFDCINPVQSTQTTPMTERFDMVEADNGHQ